MKLENYDELRALRENHKDKKIVFCSGTFDLTHAGHAVFFENCKKLGDILVVGIGGDSITKARKGDVRPIFNEAARLKMVDSLKPVDFTLLDNVSDKEHKLRLLDVVFEKLKPDVYVVREDAFDMEYRRKLCEDKGTELVVLGELSKEFADLSTTSIIEKLKKC
jgi:cytidyltransferase-like protein